MRRTCTTYLCTRPLELSPANLRSSCFVPVFSPVSFSTATWKKKRRHRHRQRDCRNAFGDFGIDRERERERETGSGVKGGRTDAQERIWIPRLACPARPNPTHPVVPAVRLPRRPAPWSRSCTRPAWPLARRARHTPAAYPRMKFAPPWSMLLYVLALLARGNQPALPYG